MDENIGLLNEKFENIKTTIHQSYQRILTAISVKEANTLRQLEAIRKQCEHDAEFRKECAVKLTASLANCEPVITSMNNMEILNLKDLNLQNSSFIVEDYEPPCGDHHVSHKHISDKQNTEEENNSQENITLLDGKRVSLSALTPTDDWLNYIKRQTEIEPNLVKDLLEQDSIQCEKTPH